MGLAWTRRGEPLDNVQKVKPKTQDRHRQESLPEGSPGDSFEKNRTKDISVFKGASPTAFLESTGQVLPPEGS